MIRSCIPVAALLVAGCANPPTDFDSGRTPVEPAAAGIPAVERQPQPQQPGQPPTIPTRPATRTGVSVKDYGATGNGTAGCTEALQAAIADAIFVKGVQEVYLPDGVYRITRTLHLGYGEDPFRTVRLVGSGMRFAGDPWFHGTMIVADFHSGPAINI